MVIRFWRAMNAKSVPNSRRNLSNSRKNRRFEIALAVRIFQPKKIEKIRVAEDQGFGKVCDIR